MAILTVLSASFCRGEQIVSEVTERLGYRRADEELLTRAAREHGVSEDKLLHSLHGTGGFGDRQSKERARMLACLELTLAQLIQEDNIILTGCVGFLIPGNIAHVLRVCVVADLPYRIKSAMETEGLTESVASAKIRDYDEQVGGCTMELVSRSAYDESLYDITVPVDKMDSAAAVDLICRQAESDAVKTTEWSRTHARDFLLSARVKLALTQAGHRVDVFSENGRVTVGINEQSIMMSRLQEKVRKLASEVEGVAEVTARLGSRFSRTSVNPWESIDAPPKVLLVDDEKEFVQTLSERLKSRNLESSIAYDGEQALDKIEKDVPDVIVLDLKMPGIDGIETLRRVKRSHPEVEVIILTGHGSDREQSEAENLGAFAYLRKPINVNELAQVMKEAYARRRRSG